MSQVSPNFIELLDADTQRPIMVRASAIEEVREVFAGNSARLVLPKVHIRLASGGEHDIEGETAKSLFERMTAAMGGLPVVRCERLPDHLRDYKAPAIVDTAEQETPRRGRPPATKMAPEDE
jgi:hypothetical protein